MDLVRQWWRQVTAAEVRRQRDASREDLDRARRRLDRCLHHAGEAAAAAERLIRRHD